MKLHLTINLDDERTFGPCECCGNMTRRVWGYANQDEATVAAYFVEWTPGHMDKGANFDLIIGKWGDNKEASDRKAVALDFRQLETGPAFRVIDAGDRPFSKSELIGEALQRDQVIGLPIAQTAFAVCDAVYMYDKRINTIIT